MISTRGRYALRVMIDIAENSHGKFIPLNEIAERQTISEKYLESILVILTRGNLLLGLRGKGGGYRLTKAPEQYTVGSILRLIEGSLAPVSCLENGTVSCPRAGECRTLPLWTELDHLINNYLDSVTLSDLMAQSGSDYVI